ncbi:TetR/AcrR family transcriptional regulator [Maritalea porphyrae]|uniref:TetR family transcriptional regulator n=1 Tax=Maritalea porphyrae TaxID=880732 RepID=A0ABQ5UNN8_9HYPH|nr:TetR/AcrR family transcriptional regulator [Maritalea porphyrae]GLQ16450.1 TetR family transcriptional regulator [Maritalea porphyrae]
MSPKRKIKGSSHASPERRTKDLLESSRICFAKEGYAGATIEKIASRAGLSKGSIYRFFKSKDEILLALLDAHEAEFAARWEHLQPECTSIIDAIRSRVRLLLVMSIEQGNMERVWIEFLQQEASKEKFAEIIALSRKELVLLITKGIQAGELKNNAVDVLADFLLATLEGLIVLAQVDPEFDPLQRFDRIWPLLETTISPDRKLH